MYFHYSVRIHQRSKMIWQSIALMCIALFALCDGHAISEQKIKIIHKEEVSKDSPKKPEHHEDYASSYPSYEFSYKVHDPHTHDMKGQTESNNKGDVKGEYWLIEPNGHKRIVTYHADDHSGFHAKVHYADDYHYEPKKEEESNDEAGGEEERAGNDGGEAHEDAAGGNEEGAAEEEAGGAEEESRGNPEKTGTWIHDRHWGYRAKASRPILQAHPYPSRQSGVIVRENYYGSHY